MNAGAYCSRSAGLEEPFADIGFSDEMTPLKEWTWDGNDYVQERIPAPRILLREYCYYMCRCSNPRYQRPKSRPMAKLWPILKVDVPNMERLPSMLPKPEDDPPKSGEPSGNAQPLSKQIQAYLQLQEALHPQPMLPYHRVAGGTCKPECSEEGLCQASWNPSCGYRRRCAVDPSSLQETVLDSLSHVATSYAIQHCIRIHHRAKSSLGGRDLGLKQQEMGSWPCACNATFVSRACCESESGVIWEEPHLMRRD
jgi:hypothetical protein